MSSQKTYDNNFRTDAVNYLNAHPEMNIEDAAKTLGVSASALRRWRKAASESGGKVQMRGSGNFSSDEAKEIARLKKELKDTKDALEILKKAMGILNK